MGIVVLSPRLWELNNFLFLKTLEQHLAHTLKNNNLKTATWRHHAWPMCGWMDGWWTKKKKWKKQVVDCFSYQRESLNVIRLSVRSYNILFDRLLDVQCSCQLSDHSFSICFSSNPVNNQDVWKATIVLSFQWKERELALGFALKEKEKNVSHITVLLNLKRFWRNRLTWVCG